MSTFMLFVFTFSGGNIDFLLTNFDLVATLLTTPETSRLNDLLWDFHHRAAKAARCVDHFTIIQILNSCNRFMFRHVNPIP